MRKKSEANDASKNEKWNLVQIFFTILCRDFASTMEPAEGRILTRVCALKSEGKEAENNEALHSWFWYLNSSIIDGWESSLRWYRGEKRKLRLRSWQDPGGEALTCLLRSLVSLFAEEISSRSLIKSASKDGEATLEGADQIDSKATQLFVFK
jgi:hypothetical protein